MRVWTRGGVIDGPDASTVCCAVSTPAVASSKLAEEFYALRPIVFCLGGMPLLEQTLQDVPGQSVVNGTQLLSK